MLQNKKQKWFTKNLMMIISSTVKIEQVSVGGGGVVVFFFRLKLLVASQEIILSLYWINWIGCHSNSTHLA